MCYRTLLAKIEVFKCDLSSTESFFTSKQRPCTNPGFPRQIMFHRLLRVVNSFDLDEYTSSFGTSAIIIYQTCTSA